MTHHHLGTRMTAYEVIDHISTRGTSLPVAEMTYGGSHISSRCTWRKVSNGIQLPGYGRVVDVRVEANERGLSVEAADETEWVSILDLTNEQIAVLEEDAVIELISVALIRLCPVRFA